MANKRYGDPQLILRLPQDVLRRLEKGIEIVGGSKSEFVRRAIIKALDELGVPRAEADQLDGQMRIEET